MSTGHAAEWSVSHPTPVEGVECFSARFISHVFDRHAHETFGIGTTFGGVQSFRCRGARRDSTHGHLMLFNPDDPHDGWSGSQTGFAYRMLHITTAGLEQLVDDRDASGVTGRARLSRGFFSDPVISDVSLASQLGVVTDELLAPGNSLQAAERLSYVLRLIFERYSGAHAGTHPSVSASSRMSQVRDLLESHYGEDVTITTVARIAGMSRVHATRQFTLTYGIPPHTYLNQVRIRHAKRLLLEGVAAAKIAVEVGFVDQSHFTRRFKRTVGVAPLAWAGARNRAGSTKV